MRTCAVGRVAAERTEADEKCVGRPAEHGGGRAKGGDGAAALGILSAHRGGRREQLGELDVQGPHDRAEFAKLASQHRHQRGQALDLSRERAQREDEEYSREEESEEGHRGLVGFVVRSLCVSRLDRWLLGLYALLLAPLVFAPAWLPDEVWFWREASGLSWTHYFVQSPNLGYGAAWWSAYALLRAVISGVAAMWVLRAVAYVALVSIPVALFWGARERASGRWAAALWLATPAAWWTGKLCAPEVPALACAAWALALAPRTDRKQWGAWGLLGVAIGLKVTAVAALPFLAAFVMASRPERGRDLARTLARLAPRAVLMGLAGVVVVNPCLLTTPRAALASIVGAGSRWSLFAERRALWALAWEWDGVMSGGIFAHGVSLYAALAVLLATLFAGRRDREASILAGGAWVFVAWCAALYLRSRFLVWYAFPALVTLCAVVARLPLATRLPLAFVVAALGFQFVHGVPLIVSAVQDRSAHARALARLPSTMRAIGTATQGWPRPALYVDLVEVGRTGTDEASLQAGETVRELDAQYALLNGRRAEGEAVVAITDRLRGLPYYQSSLDGGLWRAAWMLVEERHVAGVRVMRFTPIRPAR